MPCSGSYSFPTKLGTYVLAARPILIHAPRTSSIDAPGRDDGYAGLWGSLSDGDGAPTLVDDVGNPRMSESRHAEAEAVRLRYYDPDRNRRTLFEALNALVGAPER